MVKPKSNAPDFANLFDSFVTSVEEQLTDTQTNIYDIMQFIEHEVNLGIELTLQQRTLLKAYYNLELTPEEISVLEFWNYKGTSTWHAEDRYQVLVVEAGRRSGKTTLASLIVSYEFYKLCKLPSPQAHYGISKNTPISIIVLATTASQGKKTIFKAVIGTLKNTKYFQVLEQQNRLFIGKEEVSMDEKLLYIYAGNSQSGGQVGGTVKVLLMDEVARFKDVEGESNAIELWSNLGIATTTFGLEAKRVAISSAWYEGDAIAQLYESTKTDPHALGVRAKSWDLNPIHAARDNPVIASEYIRDPAAAALEFEGIRPAVTDAFLNYSEIKQALRGRVSIQCQKQIVDESGFKMVHLELKDIETYYGNTVFHLDPGLQNDSYAAAFGHNEFDSKNRQIVVIDGFLVWEPEYNTQVSITNVYDTIQQINKKRPITKLTADHYNSAETIQRLRRDGISAEVLYFSNRTQLAMYDLVRTLLHEQRLILPYNSQWTPLVITELSKVQLIKRIKIDHPPAGSKDLADAVAAVCWHLASRIMRDSATKTSTLKTTSFGRGTASKHTAGAHMAGITARSRWLDQLSNKRR